MAQLPDASRGYVIEAFAPRQGGALEPDFYAMRLDREAAISQVSLLDGAGGEPVSASTRQIRTVTPPAEALLFLPALLPLAIGVALRIRWRRLLGS